MNPSVIALAEDLRRQPSLDAFWARIDAKLSTYGVTGICYAVTRTKRNIDPSKPTRSMFIKCNYPQIFYDTFGPDNLLDFDASVEHCYAAEDPYLWHDDSRMPEITSHQFHRAMIERDIGLHVGVTVPVASETSGGAAGGVGLQMSNVGLKEFSGFWSKAGADIQEICGLLDIGMRETHMGELIGLAPREKDVLNWLAVGLRTSQIADRLGISGKSVEKYIASARVKLKALTRDQALATALIFGLIDP